MTLRVQARPLFAFRLANIGLVIPFQAGLLAVGLGQRLGGACGKCGCRESSRKTEGDQSTNKSLHDTLLGLFSQFGYGD
jgi:hypothetical protein